MTESLLVFGQRLLAASTGEQHLASAYAAIGARQIACVGDGTVGTLPLRLAAQIATTTALSRLRSSLAGDVESQIADALVDAHDAVRRGLAGSPQEALAGSALTVAVVDCGSGAASVVIARIGQGRAYVLSDNVARPVFRDLAPSVGVGFFRDIPEASWQRLTLEPGERLVIMSESAHAVLAADLAHIAHGHGAQLATQRLVETARRRGQHDAIAIAIFERIDEGPRDGHHPAFARMDRERPRTWDEDGRLLGGQFLERSHGSGPGSPGAAGWIAWFIVSALLGGLTALLTAPTAEMSPSSDVAVMLPVSPVEAPEIPAEVVVIAPPPAPLPPLHPDVQAAFGAPTAARAALMIRVYVTRNYPEVKDVVFTNLTDGFLHHRDAGTLPPMMVEALMILARDTALKKTALWASELMPQLVIVAPPDGGAPPDTAPTPPK